MSGLIWAGIGKGISDASDSYGKMMLADIQDRRQAAREQYLLDRQTQRDEALFERQAAAADAAQKKAEALERVRSENRIAESEAKRVQNKEDLVKISGRADEMGAERDRVQIDKDVGKLAEISSQVKGKSPSTTPEQFRELIKQNPQYRDVYRSAGLIDKQLPEEQRALQRIDDESRAAIEIGADQSVLDYYKGIRSSVLKQIELANKQSQFEQNQPINKQRADAATTTAQAAKTRAEKPTGTGSKATGSAGKGPVAKLEAQAETIRKSIKDERNPERKKTLQGELDDVLAKMRQLRSGTPAPSAPSTPSSVSTKPKDYSSLWNK